MLRKNGVISKERLPKITIVHCKTCNLMLVFSLSTELTWLRFTFNGMDNCIFIYSMLRGSLSHSILTYPPCITDVYILMFPMLLAWLHFIIGIVGGGLLIQLATVYVIYIDCICWRWCRICCTLLVVVIPGRGSIWENWKITRACGSCFDWGHHMLWAINYMNINNVD